MNIQTYAPWQTAMSVVEDSTHNIHKLTYDKVIWSCLDKDIGMTYHFACSYENAMWIVQAYDRNTNVCILFV